MMKFTHFIILLFFFCANVAAQKIEFKEENIDLKKVLSSLKNNEKFQLPGQDGEYTAVLNDVMDEELKGRFPEVRSYDLHNMQGREVGTVVRAGNKVYYTLDAAGEMLSFYPDHVNRSYVLERGADIKWECSTELKKDFQEASGRTDIGKFSYGEELQSFKLAIITTGEFYEQHGNDDNVVMGEITKTINNVNRIYERELSFNFRLGGQIKLFRDKESDPFTPTLGSGASGRTIQSARAFRDEFDFDDYNLGITFNANSEGWPGGGLAVVQAMCDPGETSNGPTKARVWATSDGISDNAFTVLVSHEIGHAFGARHTMNADSEVCGDAVNEDNAYEIGSGNTLMSYGGYCGEGDDYVDPAETINNYFHITSIHAMATYADQLDCELIFPTENPIVDITVNPCGVSAFQIPLNTPFSVTADASDPDGDDLSYVWEQVDEDGPGSPTKGFLGPQAANSNRGPLFRGYAPTSSPTRNFPRFYNFFFQDPFESLPQVPRELTLRCTVRDNDIPNGGTVASDEIVVSVMDAGPFLIEIDSLLDTIFGGETINLSWNDDGVSALCDQVDITLISLTDPNIVIPVATAVDFSEMGVEYFVAPGFSLEGEFQFRVACNVSDCFSFYSFSPPFFSIANNCPGQQAYFTCGLDDVTANIGDESLNQSSGVAFSGISTYAEDFVVNADDERAGFARFSLLDECEELVFPSGNPVTAVYEFVQFRVSETGTYRFTNTGADFAALLIFTEENYNEDAPCGSLVGANVTESISFPGTLTTSFREWVDVDLEACVEYRLGIASINADEQFSVSVNGSGSISVDEGQDLTGSYYYVVENDAGFIEAILSEPDFRSLRQGEKSVYTILVDEETFVPADFIGKLLVDLGLEGVCVGRSSNTTEMLLINPLPDDDMDGFHTDEDCDDNDPNVNPGQSEVLNNAVDENCDGIIEGDDEDEDGFVAGVDCDDSDPAINPDAVEIVNNDVDEDCDGIAQVIDEDMDGFNSDEDCDDTAAEVNPDAVEIPNNDVDENCDGVILVIDDDEDGFNSDVDCDDTRADVNPEATEIPNNDVDENCDGEILVIDEDMDGFNSDEDCDDTDPLINPDAEEIPSNAVDEDCDGVVLNFDADMDGFNSEDDCDDSDPAVNPDAEEIANNDVDENCDGVLLMIDEDMDGFNSAEDCDDTDPAINPGAEEIPNNDVDENCDGAVILIDEDMDGFNSDVDCDDLNANVNPEAEEIPNNDVDEDCDGLALVVDEDMDGFNSDEDCDDTNPEINPDAEEIPNNDVDENCNGELAYTDEDMDGFTGLVDCNDQDSTIFPGATDIPNNGIDEDCDGEDMTSSVGEAQLGNIDLYPNPTTGRFTVDVHGRKGMLHIRNVAGIKMESYELSGSRQFLDFSEFSQGVYLLEFVLDNSDKSVLRRLVKI